MEGAMMRGQAGSSKDRRVCSRDCVVVSYPVPCPDNMESSLNSTQNYWNTRMFTKLIKRCSLFENRKFQLRNIASCASTSWRPQAGDPSTPPAPLPWSLQHKWGTCEDWEKNSDCKKKGRTERNIKASLWL